jgi:hypothetical protein
MAKTFPWQEEKICAVANILDCNLVLKCGMSGDHASWTAGERVVIVDMVRKLLKAPPESIALVYGWRGFVPPLNVLVTLLYAAGERAWLTDDEVLPFVKAAHPSEYATCVRLLECAAPQPGSEVLRRQAYESIALHGLYEERTRFMELLVHHMEASRALQLAITCAERSGDWFCALYLIKRWKCNIAAKGAKILHVAASTNNGDAFKALQAYQKVNVVPMLAQKPWLGMTPKDIQRLSK